MTHSEILSAAWQDVIDSGVPEMVQTVAFREAIGLRSRDALSPKVGPYMNQSAQLKRSVLDTQLGGSEGVIEGFEPDAAFARLSDETGIGEEELREVVLFTDDGQVDVLPPSRKLGSNVAERARNVAILIVGARYAALRERSVPIEKVRKACSDRGCYDSKNFKSAHLGKFDAVNIRSDDLLINASKWLAFFKVAVNTARGQSAGPE